jgi:hypothetical protein
VTHIELVSELGRYLTAIIIAVSIAVAVVGAVAFWKSAGGGQAITFSLMFKQANVLQMLTVILIIMGTCGLRLLDLISSEATVSIFSGIAGYVLGGTGRASKMDETEKNSN